MLKQYRKPLVASSVVTLLPIAVGLILWNRFPEQMITHWGRNGKPDGWATVPFAVFFPPIMLLAVHWLCIGITARDPGNQGRNRKPLTMVLWIIPILSNLASYVMYALALGAEFSVSSLMVTAMGLMFAVIGNYMPKMKKNSTMGIKVPWTYTSEENWNATHRFGGKCWVIGGLVMALSAFLPGNAGISVMVAATLLLSFIPIVYSYTYYRKQKEQGDALLPLPKTSKMAWSAVVILLIIMASVLFAGDLKYDFGEDYLTIEADFYNDLIVDYDSVESVEFREGSIPGLRVGGYGSFRLLMGYFENEEFGTHIRYTYYKPEACVVLTTQGNTIVLSGETREETDALYQQLLDLINK